MPLDDSCPARQSQDRQGGIFRSVNYASIRPHQGLKGVEGAINSGQHVPQPLVPSYAPSGGAHFISGANAPLGTPAVPATMAVAEQTGNGGSPKRNDHLGLQAAGALPLSNGLLHLWRSPTSSTEADGAAYGNSSYVFSPLIYPWATPFDVSASRPAVQAVATQMNNVTPYPSYDNGGGETSLGTAVCAAISAPRPTRNVTGIACSTAPIPGRSDAGSCHRSCHRAICYDQTHRQVPTRRATQPSRSRATRGPEVQFEADVNALATRLLKEGADNTAVELLRTQVFNNDVSAKALTVKSIYIEQSTGASSTRSKYRLLLADVEMKDGSNGHGCLLCPQGRRKPYKNPQDAIRHLHKAHFGFAALCIGGWYVAVSQAKPQSKEN